MASIDVYVLRERVEAGQHDGETRYAWVYTIALPQYEAPEKRGMITMAPKQKVHPKTGKPVVLPLPYQIWPTHEGNSTRFRWSRRHRGKPEMRVGLATHGAEPSLPGAVSACLRNHLARARAKTDGH